MDKNKLTLEQQFFSDKTLEFAKELYDQTESKLKEAYNGQIKNRNDLLNQIAKILLSYNIDDNILNINAADKKKLYLELSDLIIKNIKSELNVETILTKDILTNAAKEKFNTNNYVYSLGADFEITQLSDEVLEKIISTKVDDKLWSDRLYDNKNEMCNVLQKEVEKFLKGETNVNQIGQKITNKYDINAHETKRLIQDNICRVQEGANDVWQHEHGIKKVMYMATLDGKVCSRCAKYDTEVFDTDEKPVQIPQHPFCRCVYISLTNKDWHPKMRLDNETKKNVNWQSYEDWKENNSIIKSNGKEIKSSNYEKVESNIKWDNYIDISKESSNKLNEIHTNLNKFMIEQGKEKLSLLELSGNKICIEQVGEEENVKLSKETVKILKESDANDIIFVHNHPGKTTFSRDDIEKIITYKSINAMTLECEDGSKYIIQRGTYKSSSVKGYLFYNKYENIRRKVARNYPELEDDVKIYEVWDKYMNEVATAVCNDYGLIYKKVK